MILTDKALFLNFDKASHNVRICKEERDDNYPIAYRMFKVFNIGKEHAFDIKVKWKEPEDNAFCDYLKRRNCDYELVRSYFKVNHDLDYDNCKETSFLKSNDEKEVYRFSIPMNLLDLIKGWIKYIGNDEIYLDNIPTGSVVILCRNLTGDIFKMIYEMKGVYTKMDCNNKSVECGFIVEFTLSKYYVNDDETLL